MTSDTLSTETVQFGRHTRTVSSAVLLSLAHLRGGGMVMLGDDISADPRYDLVCLADRVTVEHTAFLVRHTSGFLQVAMRDRALNALQIPPVAPSVHRLSSQQCVGVDASEGIGTGISAADRTRTINTLGARDSCAQDFTRPGHVLPVRVAPRPPRHDIAGAALALAEASGSIAAVFATVVGSDPDSVGLLSRTEAIEFAARQDFPIISYTEARHSARLCNTFDDEQPTPGHPGRTSLDGAS